MAVNLLVSNSLETLSKNLATEISTKNNNVFNPITLSVQTEGMVYWLREQIAKQNGIAANLEFMKPNQVIYSVYSLLNNFSGSELSRDSLILLIYNALNDSKFKNSFPEIAHYYNSEQAAKNDLKRLNLAEKTADLFDQYQIYRTDIIEHWNENKLLTTHNFERWQSYLWQKIKETNDFHDKVSTRTSILENLKNPTKQALLQQKFPQIYFFGLSVVTQYHLDILMEIGKYTEVIFYLINPSPEIYWFDDLSLKDILKRKIRAKNPIELAAGGNPLLASWGKIIQNTFKLLFNREEIINAYEIIDVSIPEENTLLHKIQSDIILSRATYEMEQNITDSDLKDNSICISTCYSTYREIQALYDYLITTAHSQNNQIKNREIVVMATDINEYAPYIKAVFDNAPIPLPYKIADTKLLLEDNMLNALNEILSINEQNFTAERVVSLLKFNCILQKFEISGEREAREILKKANIRYGIEGDQHLDTRKYSWNYGLKKLAYGICIKNETCAIYQDSEDVFIPPNFLEGAASLDIFRLQNFANTLIQNIEERSQTKSILDWGVYIKQIVLDFVNLTDESTEKEIQELTNIIEALSEVNEVATTKVSFQIFFELFQKHLSIYETKQNFTGSGITFCSLVPMRSIPFSKVAILGLNYGVFPRTDNNTEFDLMNPKYGARLGDRNLKDGDKHLFLESILSAKDHLYLSYIGHSVKNNKPTPPSPILEEFINYIQQKCNKDNTLTVEQIITHHPLHSFSTKYNIDNQKLIHYRSSNNEMADKLFSGKIESALINDTNTIKLSDLIATINNAPQVFYKNTLQIQNWETDLTIPETEDVNLNSLTSSLLYKEAVKAIISQTDIPTQLKNWELSGLYPLKNSGQYVFNANINKVKEVVAGKITIVKSKMEPHNYELRICEHKITHTEIWDEKTITEVYKNSTPLKNIINIYIKALYYIALGSVNKYYIIGINKKEELYEYSLNIKDTKSEALEKLTFIYNQYQKSITTPIPFGASWIETLGTNNNFISFDTFLEYIRKQSDHHDIFRSIVQREFAEATEDNLQDIYKKMVEPIVKTIIQPALNTLSNANLKIIFASK